MISRRFSRTAFAVCLLFGWLALGQSPSPTSADQSNATVVSTGSTTSVKLRDRFAQIFNATDYGADPTGATSSTTALQAAADAAHRAAITTGPGSQLVGIGAVVYLKRGKYSISTTLNMHGDVWLVGESILTTQIVSNFTNTALHCVTWADSSYPYGGGILNITIDGNSKCSRVVNLPSWSYFKIENALIRGGVTGVYMEDVAEMTLEHAQVAANTGVGLRVTENTSPASTTVRAFSSWFRNNSGPGADVNGSSISFHGCIFEGNTGANGHGVKFRYGSGFYLSSPFFEGNAGHDVWLSADGGGGGAFTILDPRFSTATKNASMYPIYVDAAVSGVKINTRYNGFIAGGDFNRDNATTDSVVIDAKQLGGVTVKGIQVAGKPPKWLTKDILNYEGEVTWFDTADNLYHGQYRADQLNSNTDAGYDAIRFFNDGARAHLGTGANAYLYGTSSGSVLAGANLGTFNGVLVTGSKVLEGNGVLPITVQGGAASSATSVGVISDTVVSYTADGGVIHEFDNGGTKKSAVDIYGNFIDSNLYKGVLFQPSTATPKTMQAGTVTLSIGAGSFTFTPAFASAPNCVCSDATGILATKCSQTSTTLTVAGTGSDDVNFLCIGPK